MRTFIFITSLLYASARAADPPILAEDPILAFQGNNTAESLNCPQACSVLEASLHDRTSFPNTTAYEIESAYWSAQQAAVRSACRISPTTPEEVSIALTTIIQYQCRFAVKSGGHAAFAGASDIEGGITIDLKNLKEITVSEDQSVTRLGPGNKWFDVYSTLEPLNRTVVGGRVADIGVGGLLLGGGVSFFSGRYGTACDNVVNFEVVFADGSIHDVNEESFPDLFKSLRGGGNNFGIVTRFDVFTFPHGNQWGGQNYYTMDKAPEMVDAFVDFNVKSPSDPDAAIIMGFIYSEAQKMWFGYLDRQYTKPEVNPAVLNGFAPIESVGGNLQVNSLANTTKIFEASNPHGLRESYWTFTFQNDATLTTKILEIAQAETEPLLDISGLVAAFLVQPITTTMASHSAARGGNAFRLDDSEGPLTLFLIAISWNLASDDEAIMALARRVISLGNSTAHEMQKGHRYIYQNYAAAEQKVFEGYGEENLETLRQVSKKYDPDGVFQKLQPGYFKLW